MPPDGDVPRETRDGLEAYLEELKRWNAKINLVGESTLANAWVRHIQDSLQLTRISPETRHWLDCGSGAGLPGVPIAFSLKARGRGSVILVESDRRKAAFLRHVTTRFGLPCEVWPTRMETTTPDRIRTIAARACAPVADLLNYGAAWAEAGCDFLFLKGGHAEEELTDARRSWTFHVKRHPSQTHDEGEILHLTEVRRVS